jgi:hypothetical protein
MPANEKRIPIKNAFQGDVIRDLVVLAPSRDRFLSLIPQFEKTPAAKTEAQSLIERMLKAAAQFIK